MDTIQHISRRHWVRYCSQALAMVACTLVSSDAVWAQSGSQRAAAQSTAHTLLVVGDSLSAEYGLRRGTGWVALLEKRLSEEKLPVRVVNASISGETTSGGRSRITALLKQHRPGTVIIELGGNDALRGLPLTMTADNLRAMSQASKASGARVLLAGMQMPPNYGRKYSEQFAKLYADVSRSEAAALVPFFLAGVADVPEAASFFQKDRIHPNEQAQPTMLANVWPELKKLLPRKQGQ
jgi:acyl-CoA thioesterase I